MGLKKLILVLAITMSIVIGIMFGISYSWYAYSNAETEAVGKTIKETPTVIFAQNEFISVGNTMPIDDMDRYNYANKNSFSITLNENLKKYQVGIKINLVNIKISDELKISNYKYELLMDGKVVSNEVRVGISGGIIGFNKENKLVLGKMSAQEAVNKGIRDGIDFGPFLIVNGKPSFIKGNGGWGTAPRSAIGQRKDGIVLFLVMDGRDYKNGISGSDMVDLTEFLMRYGAYNASNLDGGTSSGLAINGELISKPVNGNGEKSTRAIPDAWIVTK